MKNLFKNGLLVTLLMTTSLVALAKELPLWELGSGAAVLVNPHYIGAEQASTSTISLSYIRYRGDFIQADQTGLHGWLYKGDNLSLNLSSSGAFPVNSKDNDARNGMGNLDFMLETGPALQLTLFECDESLLRLDVPARAAFTLGDKLFNHQGWTVSPRLYYETEINHWSINATLGAVYSDHRYHGYFYNVAADEVTTDRQFYQAKSGFTGGRFSLGVNRRIGDFIVGGFMQYYDSHGAVNQNSPLVRKNNYFSSVLYFSWIFWQSKTLVMEK